MDEMFVPYKEMFPVQSPDVVPQVAKKEGGSWNILFLSLFVALVVAVGFAWYFYTTKQETPPFRQIEAIPFNSIPKHIDIQHVKKTSVEHEKPVVQAVPKTEPTVKAEPMIEKKVETEKVEKKVETEKVEKKVEQKVEQKVEKVEKPQVNEDVLEYGNSHELAKGVGTKIRDVLLTHKQIPSLAVASIVSSTVKVLLGENDRAQPSGEIEQEQKEVKEEVRKEPLMEIEEPVKDVPRRGKINADTDASLLKLLKERGLKN